MLMADPEVFFFLLSPTSCASSFTSAHSLPNYGEILEIVEKMKLS